MCRVDTVDFSTAYLAAFLTPYHETTYHARLDCSTIFFHAPSHSHIFHLCLQPTLYASSYPLMSIHCFLWCEGQLLLTFSLTNQGASLLLAKILDFVNLLLLHTFSSLCITRQQLTQTRTRKWQLI